MDVAYDQLTLEVNMFKVNAILDIMDPKTTSAKRWGQKIEMLFDDNPEIKMHYKALQTGCETSRKNGLAFFNDLANSIADRINDKVPYPQHIMLENLLEGYNNVFPQIQEFELALAEVSEALKGILNQQPSS